MKGVRAVFAAAAVSCAVLEGASALEIITAPDGPIYFHAANPGRQYYDVMAQTIVLRNDGDAPVTLHALDLKLSGESGGAVKKSPPLERVLAQTREFAAMEEQGLGVFLKSQLLNEGGVAAVIGDNATFASSMTLAPGEFLITTAHYMASDFEPDRLVITAFFGDGEKAAKTLRVRRREQSRYYIAPVSGQWLVRAFPSVKSHHRYIPSNEFALDFFQAGPNGALDRGERRSADDDYGNGEPVRAVADGTVATVIDDQSPAYDALLRRPDESVADARRRISAYQFKRFSEDFRAAAAGNLVVIEHGEGDAKEYSSYGHLKEASIKVRVGDKVKQGQKIAEVGNTGDSVLTHLHFQMNAGRDPFFSQSLPVEFANQESLYGGQDPGLFMIFGESGR